MEVGGRLEHPVLLGGSEGATHDAVGLVAIRQPMLRVLLARLGFRPVACPLPQRQHRLLRLVDDLLAELDRLGQHDLFLGVEQRHLADLLEVHAHRIVDADHVGGDRVELLGRRLVRGRRVELGRRLLPGRLVGIVDRDLDTQLGGCRDAVAVLFQLILVVEQVIVVAPALAALEHAGYELLVTDIHSGITSDGAGGRCGRG